MPYWKLSSFYFFYFASLGALIPYWALYLESLAFTPRQIGELMAILMATKIVAPNIWGWIADHTGQGMRVVRLGSLLAMLSFATISVAEGYLQIAIVMLVFSFFWNAVLPQFEAVTLSHLGTNHYRYSNIRLWGSVGFIVTVAGIGWLLDYYGIGFLPLLLLALLAAIWFSALQVPQRFSGLMHHEGPPMRTVLVRPEVVTLLACCFLMQASHGPYYTFYSLYLEQYGYSRSFIGQLWALGVVAEVGAFLIMYWLVPRFGLGNLLAASLLLAALRWLLIGLWPETLILLVAAQLLHAASFGVFHAAAIAMVYYLFTGKYQGRGQALYSSFGFGAGGAVGSLYSGYLWDSFGSSTSFIVAAVIAMFGSVLAWRFLALEVD
ncbi:MAG TPA: MFS transporter [Gammaproteobacteria bacterium]|nr:MFS transporter [Gammaproteobacteria bacterium]